MRRWFVTMMSKFDRFMRYRYGHDQLNNFLAGTYLLLALIRWFVRDETIGLYLTVAMALVGVTLVYRFFSKKKIQRSRENHHYMNLKYKIKGVFNRSKRDARNRMNYKHFNCPNCNQKLRVPRGRGTISVTCPKCKTVFDKKT